MIRIDTAPTPEQAIAALNAVRAPMYYTVQLPDKNRVPERISVDESLRMFGIHKAVKMNFIPQMLTALAMNQVTKFVTYCRDNKLRQFLKHTRTMRASVEEYISGIEKAYGRSYPSYVKYVERFFGYVEVDTQRMWFAFNNVAKKQLKEADCEVATHLAITHSLIDHAEKFDKKMDRLISEKVGLPVTRRQDEMLRVISALCIAIEEDFNCKLLPDPLIDTCLAVLANKAAVLADSIIGEESNENKC